MLYGKVFLVQAWVWSRATCTYIRDWYPCDLHQFPDAIINFLRIHASARTAVPRRSADGTGSVGNQGGPKYQIRSLLEVF